MTAAPKVFITLADHPWFESEPQVRTQRKSAELVAAEWVNQLRHQFIVRFDLGEEDLTKAHCANYQVVLDELAFFDDEAPRAVRVHETELRLL